VDALTSVRNKGAFSNYIQELQDRIDRGEQFEFAIGVFDCDDLKSVNDGFGHDKGDIYLKTASRLICNVFQHSPVFRIGGDEFAVILMDEDFKNGESLVRKFLADKDEICKSTSNSWEQVHIAFGIAIYDPQVDRSVNDTARRADKIMYDNKRSHKITRGKKL
jgi:diguanylate cyclase (GGDEF)-like protein